MIHQHTHFDATTHGALHSGEDALGLFIAARGKVFDVNELLGLVDVFGEAGKDTVEVGEQFDGIASKGGQIAQVRTTLIAFGPSTTPTTTGPEVMCFTRPG